MTIAIHWFRQDLRLSDNPALNIACEAGSLAPIYILDDESAGPNAMGGASRWWLHHSLKSLSKDLGREILCFRGKADLLLPALVKAIKAETVTWTRCYEPWRMTRDAAIKAELQQSGITVTSANSALLWEPWTIKNQSNQPYKVFTPFFRKGCLSAQPPARPMDTPEEISLYSCDLDQLNNNLASINPKIRALTIDELDLLPSIPWYTHMQEEWDIGEQAAQKRLQDFLDDGLNGYKTGRDFPARNNVSRLSPHLHWGEISPNQVWYAAKEAQANQNPKDKDHFLSELAWREFSYSQLYLNHDLHHTPLQPSFAHFPWWSSDKEDTQDQVFRSRLDAWKRGQTGIPIVDAGMRELWQTGYMHNRVRMIVGSFLVKNLCIHWREGLMHFWDCLVDADQASNSASWQWIAGCGADAAPYFRVFNPVLQGEKFDKDGGYTKRFVPELAQLPDKFLFKPWEAPLLVLQEAGVTLDTTYPAPIVDLKASRNTALAAYSEMKERAEEAKQ